MFRLFLRVAAAFAALVGLVLLIGCFIPRNYDVEATVLINAPASSVFPKINQLNNWETWSPISESRISSLEADYSGEIAGVGAIQTWREPRGEGKMWITASQPDEQIEYLWRFANWPELKGTFEFVPSDDGSQCEVKWRSVGKLPGGPFYGYFGVLLDSLLTNEYQNCLERLKDELEASANRTSDNGGVDSNDNADRDGDNSGSHSETSNSGESAGN